jgi:hypothetical protein
MSACCQYVAAGSLEQSTAPALPRFTTTHCVAQPGRTRMRCAAASGCGVPVTASASSCTQESHACQIRGTKRH